MTERSPSDDSSGTPNVQTLDRIRRGLPNGPERTAVKNLMFGMAFGADPAQVLTALKKS